MDCFLIIKMFMYVLHFTGVLCVKFEMHRDGVCGGFEVRQARNVDNPQFACRTVGSVTLVVIDVFHFCEKE